MARAIVTRLAGAEIRAGCMASRINLDTRGHARSVSYYRDGGYVEEEQRARLIIVACCAIETPRLLLNSAHAQFPDGLTNSSGLVGTHLMIHLSGPLPEPVRPKPHHPSARRAHR